MSEISKAPPEESPDVQLWQRWRQGQRVDVTEFLAGYPSLEPTAMVAVLLIDQSERWRLGEHIPAENYLRRFPALEAEAEAVVELAYGEFLLREEQGEQPTLEEYRWRFPNHRARLAQQVDLHRELQRKSLSAEGASGAAPALLETPHTSAATPTLHPPSIRAAGVLPRAFGRYTLQKLLGKGGMGRVYLAHDPQLDRLVALKIPNPVEGVEGWRERFLTEARASAPLTHPNVCPVFEVGEVDAQPYLTMAFLEGETLAATLTRKGPFAPTAAVELIGTVARAMHEAHRRGIIHRDLKPANLMLDPNGRPVVMDFGLALRATKADDLRLTLAGVALGTPAYMPPEQAGGDLDAIGAPADVYSLGVILFEMVTGRTPFRAGTFGKLLAQIERDPPPPPSSLNPKVDPALEAIILTALAKAPTDRFASAGDFADALERHQQGDRAGLITRYSKAYTTAATVTPYRSAAVPPPRSRRRMGWLAGAALFLVVAALGVILYVETDYGQIVVQLSDPKAKVDVRVNGQEVTLTPEGGKPFRVRAGQNQKLVVSGADFETVADSFDLKRGEVHIARITLKPRVALKKVPDPIDPPKKDPVALPKKDPSPKTVAYPKKSTLIEFAGWQILTDATKDEMQMWLDARKKDKHSVMWLDVFSVAGQPAYAAVAALDDRRPEWSAALDVPAAAFSDPKTLANLVNANTHRLVAAAACEREGRPQVALLAAQGRAGWDVRSGITEAFLPKLVAALKPYGMGLGIVRPHSAGDSIQYTIGAFAIADGQLVHAVGMSPPELAAFLDKHRATGFRPVVLASAVQDNKLKFSGAMAENPTKAVWEVHHDLTVAALKAKAVALAGQGFTPTVITGYSWDGAVRYLGVWVKEPPKTVAHPKKSTLIEIAGWQILADASKDEMQTWLDARKKDKHSVMWLDVFPVQDKPVFAAVAALDDRIPGWTTRLEVTAKESAALPQEKNAANLRIASLSGYGEADAYRSAFLLHSVKKRWNFGWDNSGDETRAFLAFCLRDGVMPRGIRPYPSKSGALRYVSNVEAAPEQRPYQLDIAFADLTAFLKKERAAGYRPVSLAACVRDGEPRFAVVMEPNPEKWDWLTDSQLTTGELKTKAAALAAQGFRPSSVTAYAYGGVMRYCTTWVKDK